MAMTAEKYINEMYDKQKNNTLSQLKTAYDQNVQTIDTAEAEITPQYYEAKRQASGDAAIRRQRLNETFAANGLNTGAVGQAQLALANQESANIAGINREEANARNAITQLRANLETVYRDNVQQAIAAQDYDRANALYTEFKTAQAEAKAQVDKLITAGVMPPTDLIAASGYSNDYVSKLYNAVRAKSAGTKSGSADKDEKKSSWEYTPLTTPVFGDDALSKEREEYWRSYKNGEITFAQYNQLTRAARER